MGDLLVGSLNESSLRITGANSEYFGDVRGSVIDDVRWITPYLSRLRRLRARYD